ncbi:capsular exopolysaccharide family [Lentibacillus persicus]|uniref:non-specific protein-tyrosine kinase n=1 Tax=Lentibacillus persicus TaxID=640948 RepID=A0A1I1U990_9BACI|nr:capsular exopolysaccharide family [Lentibacillus persicus]
MILNKRMKAVKRKKQNLVTHSNPESIISDQFRTIRANIKFTTGESDNLILLFTSPGKNEGKSTAITNLAVSLSQQKEKVLLIDANLRKPAIHHIFKKSESPGLTDILKGDKKFSEAVCSSGVGQLDILTSGSITTNPAEVLGNGLMTALLDKAGKVYDKVLIDSPPILHSTETRVLANQCSGVVLVLRRGKTQIEQAADARRVLELSQADLTGIIMNEK